MATNRWRRATGGRIDRARPFAFTFDGRRYRGYAGDTLASALLANGVHLLGRSFKYHRPRGIFSAGPEEPNALVQLGTGAYTEPNAKAPMVPLVDGLVAASQNRWPSLGLDVGRANDLLSPLIPAGFYYKTFMWPAGMWMRYERVIRHAAGLGVSPRRPDPDRYDRRYAHCDVLVAGGGPAGLAAARAAAGAGARVILADERAAFGGALLAEPDEGAVAIGGAPAAAWLDATLAALGTVGEATLLTHTTVFGYYDHNYLALLERVADRGAGPAEGRPRERLWKVRARQVVLATGAIERPLTFAGNDRPGIMLAGAARRYLNQYAALAGRRAVLFTNNDDAYRTALELQAAGLRVVAAVDLRPDPRGVWPLRARAAGIRVLAGHAVVDTAGGHRLRRVSVAPLNGAGDGLAGPSLRLACDLLCISGGWTPAVHLFSQSRGRLHYDPERAHYVPGDSAQAERSAGAANGTFGLADCLREGAAAGAAAARDAGFAPGPGPDATTDEPEEARSRTLWVVPTARVGSRAKRFIDFQSDVTDKDVHLAAREGYRSVEHFKRYTTTGMGNDQGKTANIHGVAVLAEATGRAIAEIGTTTYRQPYTPVTFGAMAGRDRRDFYDPARTTPIHGWHLAHGAVFEDVGQWKRPWYYPRDGEDMGEAVAREVYAARHAIGILDATTLGKIDIRGPDSAELLNRVYTNAWSRLEIGRARYGLMLREDGMVMDDGVTARLGEHHYVMSTTTGNAAAVLAWLEEYLQTEWPELQVYVGSVTDQWATVGISGPHSRGLLAELCTDIALGAKAFPHMSVRHGTVAGVAARVMRVSFTGELSYEINVPASHGLAIWQASMAAGERYGITPFGTEAMHVLRAEKGFIIVGQDTDGTVTPGDLGMDWIVSKKKPDFLGKRSLARPDCLREDRKQLVGLLTDDPEEVLIDGAQIVEAVEPAPPMRMLGHVTSSYYSPNLGRSIALALIERGRKRTGQRLFAPMAEKTIAATVTGTVFFDPEGERLKS